jgi:hypothetical protein
VTAAPTPSIVTAPEELTATWLTDALRSGGIDGAVARVVDVRPVGTGQMASCYRVTLEPIGDAPPSVIVKVPTAGASDSAAISYRNEVNFYRMLAPHVLARLPRCYYTDITSTGLPFVLVLEDLAPAAQGDQILGCGPDEARAAVRNLADVQGPLWEHPALDAFGAAGAANDPELLVGYMAWGTNEFIGRYEERLAAREVELLKAFGDVVRGFRANQPAPSSVQHGDYRLDNLLFGADDGGPTCAVVDWQTSCVGAPLHDLAFFITTGLTTDDRREHERDLVGVYGHRLEQHGIERSHYELWHDYRFGVGHGVIITVLGAVVAPRTPRGDDMFMAMTQRVCAALDDLDSLSLYG